MDAACDMNLERMARITRDYGRMLNRSTGVCSLWTGACLGGLTLLTFGWTWERFQALGGPDGNYVLFLLRTRDALPGWILVAAFLLPFAWAPVSRGLGRWAYPERFGTVRVRPNEWFDGVTFTAGFLTRWFPLALLGALAMVFGILLPLVGRALGNPLGQTAFLWRAAIAPLLGLLWAFLVPRLRVAEASEGVVLVYVAGFLMVDRDLSILVFCLPLYALMILAVIAYGVWAHARYRRALTELGTITQEASDV